MLTSKDITKTKKRIYSKTRNRHSTSTPFFKQQFFSLQLAYSFKISFFQKVRFSSYFIEPEQLMLDYDKYVFWLTEYSSQQVITDKN